MEKKRYNGIDIIKLIAILFVPFLHYYNNFNFNTMYMTGASSLIKIGVRWISFSCIGLFIMSSGYLLCKKKVSKNYYLKSVKFIILYFIALLLTQLYNNGFSANFFTQFFQKFFLFHAYFWYVPFYLVLYYLIPYLNIVSEKLTKKEYKTFLLTLIILINIPEFYNSFPGYNKEKIFYFMNPFSTLYPFVYFYIGTYFKKFSPSFSKKKTFAILLLTVITISLLDFIYSKGGTAQFYGGEYGSVIAVIITTCIFHIFYRVTIQNKKIAKIVKFSASITFETYLSLALSDRFTDIVINRITDVSTMSYKYILVTAPVNFICAFLIGIMIHFLMIVLEHLFHFMNEKLHITEKLKLA